MTRLACGLTTAALTIALVLGWGAPANAVLVEGSFHGFVDSSFNSPVSPSVMSGTLRYDTDAPVVQSLTPTAGRYLFTTPGSAAMAVTYTDPSTGAQIAHFEVDAPTIMVTVQGGFAAPGRPNDSVFIVTADNPGLRLMLFIDETATLALPDGNLPTATFALAPDTSFSGVDFSDPNNIVRLPSTHLLDFTLMVVPEPRPPLAAFAAGIVMTLWLRRRVRRA